MLVSIARMSLADVLPDSLLHIDGFRRDDLAGQRLVHVCRRVAPRLANEHLTASFLQHEPGPRPSFSRISAGTEICPRAVTLDWAFAMAAKYHGNEMRPSASG